MTFAQKLVGKWWEVDFKKFATENNVRSIFVLLAGYGDFQKEYVAIDYVFPNGVVGWKNFNKNNVSKNWKQIEYTKNLDRQLIKELFAKEPPF